jgi:hypothetical protein
MRRGLLVELGRPLAAGEQPGLPLPRAQLRPPRAYLLPFVVGTAARARLPARRSGCLGVLCAAMCAARSPTAAVDAGMWTTGARRLPAAAAATAPARTRSVRSPGSHTQAS